MKENVDYVGLDMDDTRHYRSAPGKNTGKIIAYHYSYKAVRGRITFETMVESTQEYEVPETRVKKGTL